MASIHLTRRSRLFTTPSTLVMWLQITANPFQSASDYTKEEEEEAKKPVSQSAFEIYHRRKEKKKRKKVKGGVRKKKKKKDEHGPFAKDAAVYLQRAR